MDAKTDIDAQLDELRYRSPLTVLVAILLSALVLGCLVNVFSSALYDLYVDVGIFLIDAADTEVILIQTLLACLILPFIAVLLFLFVFYFVRLSQQQQPSVRRTIGLVLPFVKSQGQVRFARIPKVRAQQGMEQILNWALTKAAKSGDTTDWTDGWQFDGGDSPIKGDTVTIVYDFVEWMVLGELADFGEHQYGKHRRLLPGDDFEEMPVVAVIVYRKDLYSGLRTNFVGKYSNRFEEQIIKLPAKTQVRLEPMARKHGVASHGKEPVNRLIVSNPAGAVTITPSQVWRKATHRQITSALDKLFTNVDGERCYLEMQLLVEVRLAQLPFVLPWHSAETRDYQRWLLELQEQLIRHMDWNRFIETDYRRKQIEVWSKLMQEADKVKPEVQQE